MPVNPNFLERLVLHRLNRGPAPLLDLIGAAGFETVCLATDMGVFDELDTDELTVGDLATRVGADEEGLETLLTFLDAQGYVAETNGRYRNTDMTRTWMTSSSETNMAPWFTFWNDLVFPFWSEHLETTIREGAPPLTLYEWCDQEPDRWVTVQRAFRATATLVLDEVGEKVTVPDGATRLLDVGGGHGLYAIELCRRHPNLTATVFDDPLALDVAREEIAEAGLEDRITVQGGDYETDDLGSDYDVALLFNVVHAHDADGNRRLLERVANALAPGGRIAILDQFEGTARMPVGEAGLGFIGLTYLVTLGAETHRYEDLADWLGDVGFVDASRTSIRRSTPGNSIVQARKA